MDIETHTMTHPNLNDLSQSDLDYEIGQLKQCLENHGFNPTIFAYPNGKGSDDYKVVNTVAKNYDLARTDSKSSALAFLHCDGNDEQTDCSTSFSDGTLTPTNRYSINSRAHKHIEKGCSANDDSGSGAMIARAFAMSMTISRCSRNSLQLLIAKMESHSKKQRQSLQEVLKSISYTLW
jgi:peptidoglycan/xylan/chitin deacetylase (PgdA/CDA1 family)